MIGGEILRQRLSELVRSRRTLDSMAGAGGGEPKGPLDPSTVAFREPDEPAPRGSFRLPATGPSQEPEPASRRTASLGVEAYLPGGEWRDEQGAVFIHERMRSDIEPPRPDWGELEPAGETEPDLAAIQALGLENALFLDLETGGFSSSPVFMAGTMHWTGEDFVLRQYFARHYGEESALLRALAGEMRGFAFLVTFNGKSYDAPFLRDRARVHGVPLRLPERHIDLLHPSRRRWRRRLANCRLQTLELYVCHRRRCGDVPSEEVPGLYHDFVRRGDPYRLIPVFHHNLLDVITMHEVMRALCSAHDPRPPRGWHGEDWAERSIDVRRR